MASGGQNSGRMQLMRESGSHVDFATKKWKAHGMAQTTITKDGKPVEITAKFLSHQEDKSGPLPPFPNSPNSIYVRTDKNGIVRQVRVNSEYRPVLDLDYDTIPRDGIPQKHRHGFESDRTQSKNWDKDPGRLEGHDDFTSHDRTQYGELINWLGKHKSEIPVYK